MVDNATQISLVLTTELKNYKALQVTDSSSVNTLSLSNISFTTPAKKNNGKGNGNGQTYALELNGIDFVGSSSTLGTLIFKTSN